MLTNGGERGLSNNDARLTPVFMRAEIARERMAFFTRLVALGVVAVWLAILVPRLNVIFYHCLLLLFILTGAGHFWLTSRHPQRIFPRLALILFDFSLLAFSIVVDNPFNDLTVPSPLRLEGGNFLYFFCLLVSVGLGYSAWRMLASGIIAGMTWTVAVLWVISQPGVWTNWERPLPEPSDWIAAQSDPMFVDMNVLYQQLVVLGIVTAIMALAVMRSRRLVMRQVQITRERTNLARYFPQNMVEELAESDEPLGPVRSQKVAVLFADIVGFTHWAEDHSPGEAIGLLREVHSRLGAAVFFHNGTLDKFLGDGLMATFGTPTAGHRDASNAIAAAKAMQKAMADWNAERVDSPAVKLAIGVHYGPVVLGDIGTTRRMEFAVLGDAVNVASRLERATREVGCGTLISAATADAAQSETAGTADMAMMGAVLHDGIEMPGHSPVAAYALR